MSGQRNFIRGQETGEILAGEIGEFGFARGSERVEADEDLIDESRMAHDDAVLWQPVEKRSHQRAIVGLARIIVGAGECRVKGDTGLRCTASKLRAEIVEQQ